MKPITSTEQNVPPMSLPTGAGGTAILPVRNRVTASAAFASKRKPGTSWLAECDIPAIVNGV